MAYKTSTIGPGRKLLLTVLAQTTTDFPCPQANSLSELFYPELLTLSLSLSGITYLILYLLLGGEGLSLL